METVKILGSKILSLSDDSRAFGRWVKRIMRALSDFLIAHLGSVVAWRADGCALMGGTASK